MGSKFTLKVREPHDDIGPATSYAPKCRGSFPNLREAVRALEYGKVASS